MEVKNCTNCGKELHDGEWVSKSGFCRTCAEKLIKQTEPVIFNKHWLVILLMCIFGGVFGIHRFATGKMGSGLIYLLTGGIFGIGVIVDIILIASNQFTEAQGEAIKMRIPNDFYREPMTVKRAEIEHDADEQNEHPLANNTPEDTKKKQKKYLIIIATAIAFAAITLTIAITQAPKHPYAVLGTDGKPTEYALDRFVSIAHKAVRDNLKAPKTAEFDATEENWYMFEDGVYGVSGNVTADNAFGVPIAGDYFVKFECWGLDYDENEVLEVELE